MKIEDNFLDQEKFDELQIFMMGERLDWHYQKTIDIEEVVGRYQFIHMFYYTPTPRSGYFEKLNPILNKINPVSLFRIKANLLTKTPTIVENTFHVDILGVSEEKLKQLTTSIFYINTNNGYTKFEDGTKVESVANRMLTFPTNMKHSGTACTDQKYRIIINFNYFDQSQELSELQSKGYTKIKLTP